MIQDESENSIKISCEKDIILYVNNIICMWAGKSSVMASVLVIIFMGISNGFTKNGAYYKRF